MVQRRLSALRLPASFEDVKQPSSQVAALQGYRTLTTIPPYFWETMEAL